MKPILKALSLIVLVSSQANAQCEIDQFDTSATVARDIGGFNLGTHIREIDKVSPVSHWFEATYKTNRNGIEYEFDVTPLGRVYAIESKQELGQFVESTEFANTFITKLERKYGKPTLSQPKISTARWDLFENVEVTQGTVISKSVNWLAASLLLGDTGKKLNIRMVDFRLLTQDQQRLNCDPARRAQEKISF